MQVQTLKRLYVLRKGGSPTPLDRVVCDIYRRVFSAKQDDSSVKKTCQIYVLLLFVYVIRKDIIGNGADQVRVFMQERNILLDHVVRLMETMRGFTDTYRRMLGRAERGAYNANHFLGLVEDVPSPFTPLNAIFLTGELREFTLDPLLERVNSTFLRTVRAGSYPSLEAYLQTCTN